MAVVWHHLARVSDVFTVDSLLRNSEVIVPSGEWNDATINQNKSVSGCLPSGTSVGFAAEEKQSACDGDLKGGLCVLPLAHLVRHLWDWLSVWRERSRFALHSWPDQAFSSLAFLQAYSFLHFGRTFSSSPQQQMVRKHKFSLFLPSLPFFFRAKCPGPSQLSQKSQHISFFPPLTPNQHSLIVLKQKDKTLSVSFWSTCIFSFPGLIKSSLGRNEGSLSCLQPGHSFHCLPDPFQSDIWYIAVETFIVSEGRLEVGGDPQGVKEGEEVAGEIKDKVVCRLE